MARPLILGINLDWGSVGSAFGTRTAVTVGVNTSVIIPAGFWYVETDAHTTVRYHPLNVSSAGTVVTLVAASSAALIYSDGFTVEFRGDGTGGTGQQSQVLVVG